MPDTCELRRIEADMDAAEALHRRTDLGWLMNDGARVRVSNPFGGTWTGRIIALADHPAMRLERDDGLRVMLPQCFAVEELPGGERGDQCPFPAARTNMTPGGRPCSTTTRACSPPARRGRR